MAPRALAVLLLAGSLHSVVGKRLSLVAPRQRLPTLFCFAWSPRRPQDDEMMPEVLVQYKKCDGHAVFTDKAPMPNETSVYRVDVPAQPVPRSSELWLYHRNMVGLLPSWNLMLKNGMAEKYDWVLNAELDHFLSPARARVAIEAFLDTLRRGSPEEQKSADGPLILNWGNAFLFNRKAVLEMKKSWDVLGKPSTDKRAAGCPEIMRGKQLWPLHCPQDIVYPNLASRLIPAEVHTYGPSGCHQFDHGNKKGHLFPFTCFDMFMSPMGSKEDGELLAIRELAAVQHMKTEDEVKQHFRGTKWANKWREFYLARQIPIIHHIVSRKVHALARSLLDP